MNILHVYGEDRLPPSVEERERRLAAKSPRELLNIHREGIIALVERARAAGVSVNEHMAEGRAHSQILAFSSKNPTDLIAMATYGPRTVEDILNGTTTSRVVQRAPVPVLVFPGVNACHDTRATLNLYFQHVLVVKACSFEGRVLMGHTSLHTHGCRVSNEWTLRGMRAAVLENELLRVVVLLDRGAEIVEFRYKPLDSDPLARWGELRNPASDRASIASATGTFLDYYVGGWQEILPNGGQPAVHRGAEYGQHGEVCLIPWASEVVTDTPERVALRCTVRALRTPLLLERTMTLDRGRATLTLDERLTNEAGEPLDVMLGPSYCLRPTILAGRRNHRNLGAARHGRGRFGRFYAAPLTGWANWGLGRSSSVRMARRWIFRTYRRVQRPAGVMWPT